MPNYSDEWISYLQTVYGLKVAPVSRNQRHSSHQRCRCNYGIRQSNAMFPARGNRSLYHFLVESRFLK